MMETVSSCSPLLMTKFEKKLDRDAENEHLDGMFGMFLFFEILKKNRGYLFT